MPAQEFSANGKTKLTAIELRRRVVALRSDGFNQTDIARKVGKTQARVSQILKAAMAEYRQEITEFTRQEFERQLAATDELMQVHMPMARAGDRDAADMVLKILARRAKLLGLDHAPKAQIIETRTEDGVAYIVMAPEMATSSEEWHRTYGRIIDHPPQAS